MKQKQIETLLDPLTHHPARLEALLAELVDTGKVGLGEIEFQPISTFARNYSHDIARAAVREYPAGPVLRLETHREGLYDQLPYGLFHRPEPYHPGQKLASRIKETEAARAREADARRFFFPFEQEFFLTALKAELTERRLVDGFNSPLRERLLLEIWSHCTRVPAQMLPLLSYILPLSYRIAGDLELMGVCYRALLKVPITLRYVAPATVSDALPQDKPSGVQLGDDLCLGGLPRAELPVLEVGIGPLERRRSVDFLPNGTAASLLELLNDCLVPFEIDVVTVFRFSPDQLVLSKGGADDSRLGFTSRLPVTA